jgi:hypothetical protein
MYFADVVCLSAILATLPFDNLWCIANHHWCSIDTHFQNPAGSVSPAVLLILAASILIISNNNHITLLLPNLQGQHSLILHWHSFTTWGRECVTFSVANRGCKLFEYVYQWPDRIGITWLTTPKIINPLMTLIFRENYVDIAIITAPTVSQYFDYTSQLLVVATGLGNTPAVRMWTTYTVRFGSRTEHNSDPLLLGGPILYLYPSCHGLCWGSLDTLGPISGLQLCIVLLLVVFWYHPIKWNIISLRHHCLCLLYSRPL